MASTSATYSKKKAKLAAGLSREPGREIQQYQEGSITRIKVENIQTYDSVEFRPGPQLNVLIGPNGTGKSTIICAICLGLNGKPGLVNKSSVNSVVKHGRQQGVIELELFNPDGDNWIIKRTIKNNESVWAVNSRPATTKSVNELVARLNIQVENLCQFLPQEKVGEFPNMTPQQLLDNTQKAAGPPGMYENHQKLKVAREKARTLEVDRDKTGEHLDQEVQKNDRLQDDVRNFEEREAHLEKIKILKKKRPWVECEAKSLEYKEKKFLKKDKGENVEQLRKLNAPLQKKLDDAKLEAQQLGAQANEATSRLSEHANIVVNTNKAIESLTDEKDEVEEAFNEKQAQENRRLKRVNDLRTQLEAVENELNNLDESNDVQVVQGEYFIEIKTAMSVPCDSARILLRPPEDRWKCRERRNVEPKIERVTQEMQRVSKEMIKITQAGDKVKLEVNHERRHIDEMQRELKCVQDIGNRRLETLRHFNRHAYEGVKWLRANQSMFKSPIYEPIMLVLNVKDPSHAKYVEKTVSSNDMVAFVCEDPEDREKFMENVRERQTLKINVIDMPTRSADSFEPDRPIETFRQYGFYSYLRDMIECPEGVMRYLCLQYKLHNIPVGDEKSRDRVQDIRDREPSLGMFYTANHKYVFRRSRYNPEDVSSRSTELRDPRYLKDSMDVNQQRQISAKLEAAVKLAEEKEERHRELTYSCKDLEAQLDQLRNERKELMNRKNKRRDLEAHIKINRDRVEQAEKEKIDLVVEEGNVKATIRSINVKKMGFRQQLQKNTQDCFEFSKQNVVCALKQTVAIAKVVELENGFQETLSNLQQVKREYEEIKEQVKEIMNAAKRLLEKAKQATGTGRDENLSDVMKQAFGQCPNTLDEIDAAIYEEQARADLTIPVDQSTVEEFRAREQRIARLREVVEGKGNSVAEHHQEMEQLKSEWLNPLKTLVEDINVAFGRLFKEMKCAGEVDLNVPENEEDYEKYGIRIKVKFRDNEPLYELTSARQSGGERSVSTILYVMALQELTRCPFRCVDEINQGMDPINERKIFELVVKTACQDNTSQYFLLTPKLLPDLTYSERMTVHCIFNGPRSISHKDWNLKKFLEIKSTRRKP